MPLDILTSPSPSLMLPFLDPDPEIWSLQFFSQAVSENFQNGLSRCCYCCFLGTDGADVLAVHES